MARPLSFDPDAALDAAMRTFWQHGYAGSSIQDLTEATGLSRSSLYNQWGDKLGLYIAALDRYRRRDGAVAFLPLLRSGEPLARIRAVFSALVEDAVEAPGRGCFMVGASAERGPDCSATRLRTRDALSALAGSFEAAIRSAQASGDISAEKDPVALSYGLAASVYGLRTLARSRVPREAMEQAASGALAALA
ncbi:TetR/AcrR family transcriptional regulator [Rubricoccus marinus]|uniref:HTH tetR-type domain-containing protein n=1 Tax=Rubricoccus marinus TaxID=716817 RepID=A0A259U2X3_9BACT|nr:TetR/AcrR family transcriptional regulator [Rubricoccus marinus]OZC04296.1 hypothetical protein BSZ36_15690 [Rubricoccus marinus]